MKKITLLFVIMLFASQAFGKGYWREYADGKFACYKHSSGDYLHSCDPQCNTQSACENAGAAGNAGGGVTSPPKVKSELKHKKSIERKEGASSVE